MPQRSSDAAEHEQVLVRLAHLWGRVPFRISVASSPAFARVMHNPATAADIAVDYRQRRARVHVHLLHRRRPAEPAAAEVGNVRQDSPAALYRHRTAVPGAARSGTASAGAAGAASSAARAAAAARGPMCFAGDPVRRGSDLHLGARRRRMSGACRGRGAFAALGRRPPPGSSPMPVSVGFPTIHSALDPTRRRSRPERRPARQPRPHRGRGRHPRARPGAARGRRRAGRALRPRPPICCARSITSSSAGRRRSTTCMRGRWATSPTTTPIRGAPTASRSSASCMRRRSPKRRRRCVRTPRGGGCTT